MQEWVFHESYGRYEIDLGDSNVELCSTSSIPDIQFINDLQLGYGHEAGLPELRAEIAGIYPRVQPANVVVSHGAQEAFSLLIRALHLTGGGEVLVVGSGWSQHSLFPAEVGLEVRTVPTTAGGDDDLLAEVAGATTWRTRAIIVASPDNPTGWTASRELLVALSEIADVYDGVLVVDEEYVIDHENSVACLNESTAVVSGLSKMHGLPGLRLGWCIASEELVRRCVQKKHLTTISNSVWCESVATVVLRSNDVFIRRAKQLCSDGAASLRMWAEDHEAVTIAMASDSLPFAWVALDPGLDSLAVARHALANGVLVIPGDVFSRPGYLRVAVGRDPVALEAGLDALGQAVDAAVPSVQVVEAG